MECRDLILGNPVVPTRDSGTHFCQFRVLSAAARFEQEVCWTQRQIFTVVCFSGQGGVARGRRVWVS